MSAVKKNEVMIFTRKWTELEIVVLSKISSAGKHIFYMFSAWQWWYTP